VSGDATGIKVSFQQGNIRGAARWNQGRLGGQRREDVLQEVYLERASVGNPVFPEVVHHLLKRWWTTLHLCGKGVERKAQVGVVAEHLWGECFSLLKSIPSADENQRDQSVLVLLREPLVVSRYARGSRTILSLALIPLCEPV